VSNREWLAVPDVVVEVGQGYTGIVAGAWRVAVLVVVASFAEVTLSELLVMYYQRPADYVTSESYPDFAVGATVSGGAFWGD